MGKFVTEIILNLDNFKKKIEDEGFIFLGSIAPDIDLKFQNYEKWINDQFHASMNYLAIKKNERQSLKNIFPEVKTILVIALPYSQNDPLPKNDKKSWPRIAQYARLYDYHKIFKKKCTSMMSTLDIPNLKYRIVTDSIPLIERSLAMNTKQGFIGKNTCYIHPQFGSFLLLGEIFLNIELSKDHPQKTKGCGTCQRCQVHCPTGALTSDNRIDARKCISYWTIEHRGTIPYEFWSHLKEYFFGCDICQIVCPYNREKSNSPPQKLIKLQKTPPLFEIALMDQAYYEKVFGGSPLTRAKKEGLQRNALISMFVLNDEKLKDVIFNLKKNTTTHEVVLKTLKQIEFISSKN